jgi:hypothetical protein
MHGTKHRAEAGTQATCSEVVPVLAFVMLQLIGSWCRAYCAHVRREQADGTPDRDAVEGWSRRAEQTRRVGPVPLPREAVLSVETCSPVLSVRNIAWQGQFAGALELVTR